jgi:hypothetical protein
LLYIHLETLVFYPCLLACPSNRPIVGKSEILLQFVNLLLLFLHLAVFTSFFRRAAAPALLSFFLPDSLDA